MVSAFALGHMKSPHGFGEMADADGVGYFGRADRMGPYFCVFVKLKGSIVQNMSFTTYRCPWAIAAGSVLHELVVGRDVSVVEKIGESELQDRLGEVPSNKLECLSMALSALRKSIDRIDSTAQ